MQPLTPAFGGTTSTGPPLPRIFALMEKTPLFVRLMVTLFTAPLVPLYLKALVPLAFQEPLGRANLWLVELVPFAKMSRNAPPGLFGFADTLVGSPTKVFVLPFSLPEPVILRLVASPGFCFTVSDFPRIVWSAANARPAAQASPAAAATNLETCRMSSPPYEVRWAARFVRQIGVLRLSSDAAPCQGK